MGKRLYAEGTSVNEEDSRAEIERLLRRYGADGFAYLSGKTEAAVVFEAHGRRVLFRVPLPTREEMETTPKGQKRADKHIDSALERERKRRWRALTLAIKAKLEVVESEIASFEEEFMAHILLPDGSTLGQWVEPQLEQAYAEGEMPPLLQLGPGGQ